MNEKYEFSEEPLNKTIIRYILDHKLPSPVTWTSVKEFEDRIKQYHEQNGGSPPKILDQNSPVYGVLQEFVRDKKLERKKERGITYYRSVHLNDPVQNLLIVIREEYERLDTEIALLENRKVQLEILLSEHGTSATKPN